MKIVYLPLDERPCNYAFAQRIAEGTPVRLAVPPIDILGRKKTPADADAVRAFLLRECQGADALVLSLDMLLYGGIVPSRLHGLPGAELDRRLETVREIKQANPTLRIYAFALIMRCPSYSSADEEPTYYELCGREIFLTGQVKYKSEHGLLSPGETEAALAAYGEKTEPYLADYENRRRLNRGMLEKILTGYRDAFRVLVIPQDDSAPYGYTTADREYLKAVIARSGGEDVPMYPGADEVGMTLLSRAACELTGRFPAIFPLFPHPSAPGVVPLYEDRPVGETLPLLLQTSGCRIVSDENGTTADIHLYLNYPASDPVEAGQTPTEGYRLRNLTAFAEGIVADTTAGRCVAVADGAFCNGGDAAFMRLLADRMPLTALSSYAGWNTSSNTIGTAVAAAVFVWLFGRTDATERFIAERLYEDIGYCGYVRAEATALIREMGKGYGYFNAGETDGEVAGLVRERLAHYMEEHFPEVAGLYEIDRLRMPWKRMFEIDLTLRERAPSAEEPTRL